MGVLQGQSSIRGEVTVLIDEGPGAARLERLEPFVGEWRLEAPGFPLPPELSRRRPQHLRVDPRQGVLAAAALARSVQRQRQHHQRSLGEVAERPRLGARLRARVPATEVTGADYP